MNVGYSPTALELFGFWITARAQLENTLRGAGVVLLTFRL